MAPLGSAVYHASDEKDFEQQPPAKVVLVEVEFNYNVQTFIVAEEPRATFGELDQEYYQPVIITTKELGERLERQVTIVGKFLEEKETAAANVDFYEIRQRCAHVRLKSDLFRGWKSIRRNNLQKQMEQINLGQSCTAFVQNALQFFSKKSLQNTHRVIVYINMGEEIGQIS
ncbi:predicted protein [Chaetoceros tenuissimus]|uniref:Uncharacterized protein n=1 Tax=Chaetoceros tenuissimus TaxID=426638 RepID=A0AAD3CW36_9STRA|nr:predicted protein [Chaetoceros tenuissimus]